MPMLIIGGDAKKKSRSMIGGDDYEDAPEEESEDGPMDAIDKKREAARLLVRALGAPPSAVGKVEKALEAFVYACEDE